MFKFQNADFFSILNESTTNDSILLQASNSVELEPIFNLEFIKKFFSTNPLNHSWAWHDEGDKILFTQMNRNRQIRCHIECDINLTIKVILLLNATLKVPPYKSMSYV